MYKVNRVVTQQTKDYFKEFHRQDWDKWIMPQESQTLYTDIAAICYLQAMELQDILKKVGANVYAVSNKFINYNLECVF